MLLPPRIADVRNGYIILLNEVATFGEKTSPRGEPTRELLNVAFRVSADAPMLPVGVGRGVNTALAAAEALQLIGGFTDPDLMVRIAPVFERFRETTGEFAGPYGALSFTQLPTVIRRLMRDPHSRQATVTIWSPREHTIDGLKDYPCSVTVQFMIRAGKLNLHLWMRSNDAWLGLSQDAFQWTQLQLTVARALGVEPGDYFHNAASFHLYERDIERLNELHAARTTYPLKHVVGIGRRGHTWAACVARARTIWQGGELPDETKSERWYRETLTPFLSPKE